MLFLLIASGGTSFRFGSRRHRRPSQNSDVDKARQGRAQSTLRRGLHGYKQSARHEFETAEIKAMKTETERTLMDTWPWSPKAVC